MDEPVTPDNTRVFRIMGDFREFMKYAGEQPGSSPSVSNINKQRQGIPFNISENDEASSAKRPRTEILANARIAQIESKHVSDERAHNIARLDLETKNDKLISENKLLKDKCDGLQLKIKEVTKQAIGSQDKLNEFRKATTNKKENFEKSLLDLQKVNDERERVLETKITDLEEKYRGVKQYNSHVTLQMNAMQERINETSELLANKTSRIENLVRDLKDHENCEKVIMEMKMENQNLKQRLSRSSEAEEMAKVLSDDLERQRKLELEVVRLRDQNETYREKESNVELMKEKLLSAESKLARNEKRLEKAAVIELENRDLIVELNELRSKEVHRTADAGIMEKLCNLQQKEAMNSLERGELQSEMMSYKKRCETLEEATKNLEKTIEEKSHSLKLKDTQIHHLQKRALLLAGERNGLRGILQSYDAELSTSSHAELLLKRAQSAELANEKVHTRITDLEEEVMKHAKEGSELKIKMKELQDENAALKKSVEEGGSAPKADETELERLRVKVEDLERERAQLQKEKEHLELWVGRNTMKGDYDPSKTKVIHFSMNPADMAHKQAKREVAELRAKCQKLQEKIVKLESNEDVTTTGIDTESSKKLEEKLAASELKNQRLKEVFSKRIQEFRQACYTLTGYRIDFTHDTQFKLVSMYAENEEDYLLFQREPSGVMQLLETEYSKTLANFIQLHLHHQNSIPMFLCSVTSDLFSQQTAVLL